MIRLEYTVKLIDDVVLSKNTSTTGSHQSLDHIPGATILGLAASKLYKAGDTNTFALFHSGKVKFTDATLTGTNGAKSYPTPLSLHYGKEDNGLHESKDGFYDANFLINYAATSRGEANDLLADKQPKQLRDGYITLSGEVCKPKFNYKIKTAISSKTGSVEESQLYGYESLQAGQTFTGYIDIDEEHAELAEELTSYLNAKNGKSNFRIGRSKSAQYGRVVISVRQAPTPQLAHLTGLTQLTLLLTSDMALYNEFGQPSYEFNSKLLGLEDAKVLTNKTFVKTRQYSKYNAHRRQYDSSRQVISKGSVITLEFSEPISSDTLQTIRAGLGLYKEEGLGQVEINSPLIASHTPNFQQFEPAKTQQAPELSAKSVSNPLIDWLNAQASELVESQLQERIAQSVVSEIAIFYQLLRKCYQVEHLEEFGPTRTQWGQVEEVVSGRELSPKQIKEKLFVGHKTNRAICQSQDGEGWNIDYVNYEQTTSSGLNLSKHFKDLLDKHVFTHYSNQQSKPDDWYCSVVVKIARMVKKQSLWAVTQGEAA